MGTLTLQRGRILEMGGSRVLDSNPATSSCVTKAKLYTLSEPQLPHVYNGTDARTCFIGTWGLMSSQV